MTEKKLPDHCTSDVLMSLGALHEKVDALNKKVEKQNGRVSTNEKWIRSAIAIIAFIMFIGTAFGKPILNNYLGDRWTIKDQKLFESKIKAEYARKDER